MTVEPIASGSAGNAIVLREGARSLLLECGLPWRRIQAALGWQAHKLDAVLVSHEHSDHALAAPAAEANGVPVVASGGTLRALHMSGWAALEPLREQALPGGWSVVAVPAAHDAAEPTAFLVRSPAGERAAYVCDSGYVRHRFGAVTVWLVEANYDPALVAESLDPGQRRRIAAGHMSIAQCCALLRANDLSRSREVWLLHLSDRHADAAEFRRRAMAATGLPVRVARAKEGACACCPKLAIALLPGSEVRV